jgi:hypothetical protein
MKKTTLAALAVFVLLGLAWLGTREPTVSVGVRKLTPPPVKADELVSLQAGPITLALEDGAWKVSRDGKTFAADADTARRFARALAELPQASFVTDRPAAHAEYEVDDAKGLVLRASTKTGAVRDLVLGKTSTLGGAYVRPAGSNEVFVLGGELSWLARRGLTDWRHKRIEVARREDLARVTLTPAGGAPTTLLVGEGQAVTLEGPTEAGYRFDAAAAGRLVQQLTSLTAQDFTEEPVTPAFTVTLGLKAGGAKTLTLGSQRPDGTVPLAVEGDAQGYVLSGWVAEQLQKDREGLRDLRLLGTDVARVQRVTLTTGKARTVVERGSDGWRLLEPKAMPAGAEFDASQVERQLRQLTEQRALRLAKDVPDARAGLARPAAKLELSLEDGTTARLLVGSKLETGAEVYARGVDPFVLVAPSGLLSNLERGAELFQRPPAPPPGAMQGLEQLPPEVRAQLEAQLRGRN